MFKPAPYIDSIQARESPLRNFWVCSSRTDLKLTKPHVDMSILLRCNQTCCIQWRSQKVALTPSTQSNLFPKLISFFHVETHKVSTSIRGGFHILLHTPCHEEVHSARSSCTTPERVRNQFEFDEALGLLCLKRHVRTRHGVARRCDNTSWQETSEII